MSSPAVALPRARARALTTRYADFWLLGGASLAIWWVMVVVQIWKRPDGLGAVNQHFAQLYPASFLLAILVNNPHFLASYRLAYSRGGAFLKRHPLQLLVVPVLLGAWITAAWLAWHHRGLSAALGAPFTFLGLQSPGGASTTTGMALFGFLLQAMYASVGWHYSKQAYGCMMVYAEYDGYRLDARQRGVLRWSLHTIWWASFVDANAGVGVLNLNGVPYWKLGFPEALRLASLGAFVAGVVATAVFVVAANVRRGHGRPSANFLVPFLSFAVWFVPLLQQREFNMFLVPLFHGLQYLPFVFKVEGARLANVRPEIAPLKATAILFGVIIAGFVAFNALPNWLNDQLRAWNWTALPFWVPAAVAFINIHHYFIDNVLWRLRDDPEVARIVLER